MRKDSSSELERMDLEVDREYSGTKKDTPEEKEEDKPEEKITVFSHRLNKDISFEIFAPLGGRRGVFLL